MITLPEQPVNGLYATTTPIIYQGENGHATGFFYLHDSTSYLITNRHAVDFKTENGDLLSTIRIYSRPDTEDITSTQFHNLSLLDESEEPLWLEHPEGYPIDIVALPLEPPIVEQPIQVDPITGTDEYSGSTRAFTPETFPTTDKDNVSEIVLGFSGSVILGYPFRIASPYLPVARNALISSPYGKRFDDDPKFMTDAQTHQGLSGSPVISAPHGEIWRTSKQTQHFDSSIEGEGWRLLGVHSDGLETDFSEPLGLNAAWYSTLIRDIIESQ